MFLTELLDFAHKTLETLSGGDSTVKGFMTLGLMGVLGYFGRTIPQSILNFIHRNTIASMTFTRAGAYSMDLHNYAAFMKWFAETKWAKYDRNRRVTFDRDDPAFGPGAGFHWFFFEGRYFWFHVVRLNSSGTDIEKEEFTLYTFGRTTAPFEKLVEAFRIKPNRNEIRIFAPEDGRWSVTGKLKLDCGETLVIDPQVEKEFFGSIDWFVANEPWYRKRGRAYKHTVILEGPPGTGKAQPLTSLVKVPGGWKKMGEIQVGDMVTAWDGKPTRVDGVFPQGKKQTFSITFRDGRTVEACDEHLWKVFSKDWKTKENPTGWRIINTTELFGRMNSTKQRMYVPLCKSEDGPTVELPIHPYNLGVLLGDGGLTSTSIVLTKGDQQLFDLFAENMPDTLEYTPRDEISRAVVGKEWRNNCYRTALDEMGLMGKDSLSKFVPAIYLNASHEQRLALLQGLMDTDGTVDKSKSLSFCSSSYQLATHVQYLVRSLGGMAKIKSKQTFYTYQGERKEGAMAYNVNIRYPKPSELFRLDSKRSKTNDDNQYAAGLKLEIKHINLAKRVECQCISVEHEDHLYVTDGFTVTHNTSLIKAAGRRYKRDIHFINLATDGRSLQKLISQLRPGDLICIEDFDDVKSLHRRVEDPVRRLEMGENENKNDLAFMDCDIQLSTFLNILQGVVELDDLIIVLTTNHIEKIDPAVYRPSRVDKKIHVPFLKDAEIKRYIDVMYDNPTYDRNVMFPDTAAAVLSGLFNEYPHEATDFIARLDTMTDAYIAENYAMRAEPAKPKTTPVAPAPITGDSVCEPTPL